MKMELLGGLNVITNLTKEEKLKIKKDLTLDNPAYIQAKKFGKGYVSAPPFLFYYKSVKNLMFVPRGYFIQANEIKDSRVSVKVSYPKLAIELRETQKIAYNQWLKNTDRGVTVLPTGKGKSIYGSYLAYATKQKALIIVQKDDLVDGWTQDILTMFPSLSSSDIGLIKAKKFKIGEQYTISTIQTLSKLDPIKLASLYDQFGMIIVDECHHIPSNSYKVLSYFRAKFYVGLTATDLRDDGLQQVIYWMLGDVCYRHVETSSSGDEDIMGYKVIIRPSNVVYQPEEKFTKQGKRVPVKATELNKVIAESISFNNMVARDILKEYRLGKSCIAFIREKEHIRVLRHLLIKIGVPDEQIQLYYGDSKEKSHILKARAESKEVLITLATYAKATEGTNVKAWERAFLVSSINSIKNTIQAVGRVRRCKQGKNDVIVYDYTHPKVKCVNRHIETRLMAYRQTKAKIVGAPLTKISRGWSQVKNRYH